MQEKPAEPDALAGVLVHAVVPVAAEGEQQAVLPAAAADGEVERADTVPGDAVVLAGERGGLVPVVLPLGERLGAGPRTTAPFWINSLIFERSSGRMVSSFGSTKMLYCVP